MLTTLLILATITFVSMMSPGPDMLLIVRHSNEPTRWPAVTCITGISLGLLVHVTFSIFGIATAIAASTTLYSGMKLAGAGYLIYIGLKTLLTKEGMALTGANKTDRTKKRSPFRDGFLCNVLNPKVTIFILAVFTQIIEPATPTYEKYSMGFLLFLKRLLFGIFL